LGPQDTGIGEPSEEGLNGIQEHTLGANRINGVAEPHKQPLKVILTRFLDLAGVKVDVIESQFFFGHELWQVKSEGGDVGDQVINTLFKSDADARLPQLRPAYEEFHAEQGLAAAGTTTDQSWPPPRQATQGNLVQSFDACRGLGKLSRPFLSLVNSFGHTVDSLPLSRVSPMV